MNKLTKLVANMVAVALGIFFIAVCLGLATLIAGFIWKGAISVWISVLG